MKYMLLLYADMSQAPKYTPDQAQVARQSWFTLLDEMKAAGVYLENYGLGPVSDARTVRVRNDKAVTRDGPFAETREQLGGYFMLECQDRDEAIRWATKIPYATSGSIEVRPIVTYA